MTLCRVCQFYLLTYSLRTTLAGSTGDKGDEFPRNGLGCLCGFFFYTYDIATTATITAPAAAATVIV